MGRNHKSRSCMYLRGELEIDDTRIERGTKLPQVCRDKLARIKKAYEEAQK